VKLTTQLHIAPQLRLSGAAVLLPCYPFMSRQGQLAHLHTCNLHTCTLFRINQNIYQSYKKEKVQIKVGRDSSVGIATRYGLDSPTIGFQKGVGDFRVRPDRPWYPPSLLHNGYQVCFPRGKAAGTWCSPPTRI